MAEIKQTVPFSFDEIYQSLVEKFAEKGYDSPYDGSDLAQLITGMSYIISMLNANTAININETILPLAQKRKNIIQDARLLGYEYSKKISYQYILTLEFQEDGDYSIPKYTVFVSNSKTYYYFGDDLDLIGVKAGDTITITVKEGKLIKHTDDPQLSQIITNNQYIDIPYRDVEDNGLEVFATFFTEINNNTTKIKLEKSDTFLLDINQDLTHKFIRLENINTWTPRIYFVFSGVGKALPPGTIIEVNVLQSSGKDGEMVNTPTCPIENIKVIDYVLKIKGADEESNESIKLNAPLLKNTANRVITANDYKVICQKHSACKNAFIFGGEDEHPQKLGNIYFSFTPEKMSRTFTVNNEKTLWTLNNKEDITNNYLLDSEIESSDSNNPGIFDSLKQLDLPALKYNVRHPMYTFIDINAKITKYLLTVSHKQIREDMFNIINEYIKTLENFETEFFKSNLIKRLDNYLTDITGVDISVDFNIMIDKKSIVHRTKPNEDYSIYIYLDTPYEGIYDNDGYLILENLPKIDTDNFLPGKNLRVDTSCYERTEVPDENKDFIILPVFLNNDKVGSYIIFNDNTTYIRVKLQLNNDNRLPVYPEILKWDSGYNFDNNFIFDYTTYVTDNGLVPIDASNFDTPRYIHLKYPSENIKTIRNTIFKLNKVSII